MRNGTDLVTRDYRDVIAKVAAVKDLDVEKLRQIMQLQEDYEKRQAATLYNEQMSKAQGEMQSVWKNSPNPQTHSRYADLAALDNAIRPIYTKNGFSIQFDEEPDRDDRAHVVAYVSCGAETRRHHFFVPFTNLGFKGLPNMTMTHAKMSAITYARRGLLKMIFNLAEEDDDGNRAGGVNGAAPLDAAATQQLREQAEAAAKDGEKAHRAFFSKASQQEKELLSEWKPDLQKLYPRGGQP